MEPGGTPSFGLKDVELRPACNGDLPALRELFQMGVREGHVPESDTGDDLDRFDEFYCGDGAAGSLWVAALRGDVVGMVGVLRRSDSIAEIRRLRVLRDFRRHGIGSKLMEKCLAFCREHGYLKIILDTRIEEEPAIRIFQKFGFQLGRTRDVKGRRLIDFYLDMYREPKKDSDSPVR